MTGIMQMMASHRVPSVTTSVATIFDFSNPPQLVSAQFNGTSHQLLANSSVFTRTTDFTVEGWYYAANVTGTHYLFTLGTETSNRYSYFLSGNAITSNIYGGNSISYSSTVSINTWNHIAVVRSGSTVKLFLNGNASATTDTQSGTIGTGNLRIGADSGGLNRFQGNISNFRVSDSAVYINDFIRPTRPFLANGNVAITSAIFSGSNDLSVPNGSTLDPGTSDFTIEFWTYLSSTTNNASFYRGNNNGVDIFMNPSGRLAMGQAQVSTLITDTVTMTTGAWVHVAAVRISGTTVLYKNGVSVGSAGDATNYVTDSVNYIGFSGSIRITGYISNLRVVVGLGVYTGAFTPPTSPLTVTQSAGTNISAITAGQTQLLLNTYSGDGFLTDASTNNFTVTNNNGVTSAALNPVGL